MTIAVLALFVAIFGAYAYGYLLLLWLRQRLGARACAPRANVERRLDRTNVAMMAVCTAWFVLQAILEFRFLMGDPRENDVLDLLSLTMTFAFPGLILQLYVAETRAHRGPDLVGRAWDVAVAAIYAASTALALCFAVVLLGPFDDPPFLRAVIFASIGAMFTAASVACLALMRRHGLASPRAVDPAPLQRATTVLFASVIAVFLIMNVVRGDATLTQALSAIARSTPLFFLAVSVYFENRIEFYDLVIKRGVLLIITLLLIGIAFTAALGTLDALPPTPARPWLFAVLLLPVAMILPWLHDRTARLLDRLWFGRELTPADAVWRVLAAMQQATDEASLIASTKKALSEIFQRPVDLLLDEDAAPEDAALLLDVARASGATPFRVAVGRASGGRALLSEDVALLRSLASVFGHMLENIRLQRRRQEQEQLAQQLRLQSSRSELKALRAQINPHFLFNALNAIASLIHTDPARADRAVEQLAEMFRHTLRRSEQDWAPLHQELSFARAYLEIEKARFGPRLEFSIDSDERLQRAYVPSMLLQTLVENAVKHGIARLRTPGRIDVRADLHGARVVLEVRDTGPGFDPPAPVVRSGEGFGLRSVRDRLRGHFGDEAALRLERERGATVARIDLPLIEVLAPVSGGRT